MNEILALAFGAALLCGSANAALAATAAGPTNAQLQAQLSALQAQVAALQADGNVQTDSVSEYSLPSGG